MVVVKTCRKDGTMGGISNVTAKNVYQEDAVQKAESENKAVENKKAEDVKPVNQEEGKVSNLTDAYISSKAQKPTGLYNVEKDKGGKTVIKYDDPKKGQDVQNDITSKMTLKSKKDTLKMKLKTETDERKVKELKRKISDIDKQIRNENN